MNTKEITAIALKLFALWLLSQIILTLPTLSLMVVSVGQFQEQVVPVWVYLLMTGCLILIGLLATYLIWRAASSVLTKYETGERTEVSEHSQKFLLQLGGIFFIVTALAYLPRSFNFPQSSLDGSYVHLLSPLGLLFQLVVGLALVANSGWWMNLLAKLRSRR